MVCFLSVLIWTNIHSAYWMEVDLGMKAQSPNLRSPSSY